MAANMASTGHTRSKSLRVPADSSFLKRPSTAPSSSSAHPKDTQDNGPTHLTLFLRNLRLLSLDLHHDWPSITSETFSTKDNTQNIKRRIQSVEWTLYQLFCLWDPRDAHEKLAPFFPPLEPIQSIKLRGALHTCLDHLKKNGVLGRDVVMRKTMLDECKGERLEEVLSVFSTAVLKDVVLRDGGHEAIAQQLALEKFHYTSVPTEELSVLVLAHQVSLRNALGKKAEAKGRYNWFANLLRERHQNLAQRKEKVEKAIEKDGSTEFVSRAETETLQDRARKNWYGSNEWLEAVIHGDGPAEAGGLLSQPFENVWKKVEAGDLEEVEAKRRKGLLEQLDARVQEQNSRLKKWQSFGEQINSQRKSDRREEKEKKLPANLDLGIGAHEELQLKSVAKEEQKTWAPRQENASLLDKLRRDMVNVGKPKRVASPAMRRVPVYEEQVSRSPSPELAVPRQQSMLGNNTPRKQDWAPMAQNNTPRAQDWDFNANNGRESVDLEASPCPSPEPEQHVDEDVEMEMDMGDTQPVHQEKEEDSYEDINHEDAMDVDEPEPQPIQETHHDETFTAPPPPAVSRLRSSPSPFAAQNLGAVKVKYMPPPPVPWGLSKNTPSKSDLQSRLRFSARKREVKKPTPPKVEKDKVEESMPESPDLATKILNSMEQASPSPVRRHQPMSLAERTKESMLSASRPPFDPAFSKPREIDSDDESLKQFTPRPVPPRQSSATNTGMLVEPDTITRTMSLADRTRISMMSAMKNSNARPVASLDDDMDDLMAFTPRPSTTVSPTSAQHMKLAERSQMSMRSVRPKSTIKKSRQSIANLEEYDELQLAPSPQSNLARNPKIRLSSVPFMDGMAEGTSEEPDFGAAEEAAQKAEKEKDRRSEDLIERTRQSMKDLELVSQKAQLERKRSVRVAAKKKRESYMPQRSVYEEEDTLTLIENAEEVPYEDAFRSRPKIAMSPNISPAKGNWRDGSVSPFPTQRCERQ